MRTALLLLLCSCAHVQTEIPASLPHLYIDPALTGTAISREAGEVFALIRIRDKANCSGLLVDEEAKTKMADAERDAAKARAGISIGSALAGSLVTVLVIFLAGGLRK